MAYEFGSNRIAADQQNRNRAIYSTTVFGQSILENPVPEWTGDKSGDPLVIFQDPKTEKSIGMKKNVFSLGLLALGMPGTGKTNLFNMILSRLLATMSESDILVIFDTKGDYLAEFGNSITEKKIVIGTGEEYNDITAYHNIFAEIMPRGLDGKLVYSIDSDTDALDIAEQLFRTMGSETQPIFPAMAEQIFAAVLIYHMRTYWRTDQSKLNNRELIRFFTHSTNEDLRAVFNLDYMQDQKSCIDYIANKSNQTQGVSSYIASTLRKQFVGPFAAAADDPSREFSMREVVSGGRQVIFIEYDLKRGYVLSPMYGILIDRALANALGGRQKEKKNIFFLLDEMLLLPKLEHLGDALNFGRSQGVRLMCGLQNTAGIEELYGEAGAKNMLSSFQNMIVFRLNDYETRRFVVQRLGENYQDHSISPLQDNLHVQREGHTVEDWQLLSLQLGEAVVSLAGEKPFLFTLPRYS